MTDGEPQARRKGTWTGRLLLAGLLLPGVAMLVHEGIQEARQAKTVEQGKPAPMFEAERLGGGTLELADLRGKVVMLDFWATWCPPCVEEMPTLVKLAKEYEARGLVLVAADRIESDSKVEVGLFVSKLPPLPPNAHVVFADDEIARRYNIQALPTLFFVDREGRMKSAFTGYAPESVWRQRIEEALGP